MKRAAYVLVLILLSTVIVSAEVTRKRTVNQEGAVEYIYYSNGKEVARQTVDDNGNIVKIIGKIPDGTVKEYYKSGKLKGEGIFRDGKIEGIARQYYENGKLKTEWNFKNGALEGISKRYYESGGIRYIDTYKNGERIDRKAYDEEGKVKKVR